MTRFFTFTFLLTVLIAPTFAAAEQPLNFQENARIDKFVHDAPLFIKGRKLQELKKIGKLKKQTVEKSVNPYDPKKIDEFWTLQFDGLDIYGYLHKSDELWPIHITITKPRWKLMHNLTIGTDYSRVVRVLGPPTKKNRGTIEYSGEADSVVFHFTGAKVSKIELFYYVD